MMTSTNYSNVNVRPRRYRGTRSSKKSILYSDYNTEEETKNGNLSQRSISLNALPHNESDTVSVVATTTTSTTAAATISMTPSSTPGPLLEPRITQLETLEAKMANIEVSLSTTQRRKTGKKNGSVSNISKSSSIGATSPASVFASIRSNTLIDTCRELEVLRNALKDKENTIQNLQGQINGCGRLTGIKPLDPAERRGAELKLQRLKQEEEAKKSAIKKINELLRQMDANESNIDLRIKQAELEYELGREELGLMGVREELRILQARFDAKPMLTLYSSVDSSGKYALHCVQLEYDPKSPRFGAGNLDGKIGLYVVWAADNSGLEKGDRILEVNGKLTLSTSKEEMIRLLSVCPTRAEIVILRIWVPPPSAEDFLRRENLRLTHRISYLEDQVSELLQNVPKMDEKQTEVYQKGAHVAVLSASSTNGPKSNSINSFNSIVKVFGDSNDFGSEKPKQNGCIPPAKSPNSIMVSVNGYQVPLSPLQKYQDSCKVKDKNKNPNMKYESNEDHHSKRHFKNVINFKNEAVSCENSYSLSDLERPNRKSSHYFTSRMVDYSSETSCQRYKFLKDKKVETDEESVYIRKFQHSEPESERTWNKPILPKKPLRLTMNRATSLHKVDAGCTIQSTLRKVKRSQKGEAPPPPILQEKTINGFEHSMATDRNGYRNELRTESWAANQHHIKNQSKEQ